MLTAADLTKRYGPAMALEEVSLSVRPGELTVVLGPSGSGKTTLLRCLSLLELPQSGRLEVDGITYSFPWTGGDRRLYPKVGAVFQNLALWPHLTLRENILLPLQLLKLEATHLPHVTRLMEVLGMAPFVDRLPHRASGGERQRAALVRALALRPSYLLLDEITSALDVEQVAVVLQELQRLKREGMGILLITHLIHFARQAAEKFVFISEGRVLESGVIGALDEARHPRLQWFLSQARVAS